MNIQFSAPFFEGATSFVMCIFVISVEDHVAVALIAAQKTHLSYKPHNVVYTSICSRCNVHMYVVGLGLVSMAQRSSIPYNFWEIGQCFVLRRRLLVGLSIASEEMLLLLGRRWTKKVVLVNYQ